MKLWSDSWPNGERIPADATRAAGSTEPSTALLRQRQPAPRPGATLPAGTHRWSSICHDFDVPSRGDDVNQAGREIPADLPRVDFFHWLLADMPARDDAIAEGAFSKGFTPRGKPGPASRCPDSKARARASTTSPAGSPAIPQLRRRLLRLRRARTRRGTTR